MNTLANEDLLNEVDFDSRNNKDGDILFPASEASMRTDLQIQHNLNDIMRPIVTEINKAINKMKKFCYVNSLSDIQKRELSTKGYKLDYIPGDPHDPRECSQFKISWS